MNKKIQLAFLLVLVATSVHSQIFLKGKILEEGTQIGIPYANLSLGLLAGSASNEDGTFLLKVEPGYQQERIIISCLGYSSKSYPIDSLITLHSDHLEIYLAPHSIQLDEVTIQTKRLAAVDVTKEAIDKIPQNFTQHPFNMEFYSKISVSDSDKTYYTVENIIETYRSGYIEGTENHSRVLQKRVTGESPLKEAFDKKKNVSYFPYEKIAVFDIFIADMIGVGKKYDYTVFNPKYFKKLDFKLAGFTVFESDTVSIIEYAPKKSNKSVSKNQSLYISTKDLAILKHNRTIGEIQLEISYRKWGQSYFPYFIKAIYPVDQKGDKYQVILEVYIQKITTENIQTFDDPSYSDWHLEDIPYNKAYWDANYPMNN